MSHFFLFFTVVHNPFIYSYTYLYLRCRAPARHTRHTYHYAIHTFSPCSRRNQKQRSFYPPGTAPWPRCYLPYYNHTYLVHIRPRPVCMLSCRRDQETCRFVSYLLPSPTRAQRVHAQAIHSSVPVHSPRTPPRSARFLLFRASAPQYNSFWVVLTALRSSIRGVSPA